MDIGHLLHFEVIGILIKRDSIPVSGSEVLVRTSLCSQEVTVLSGDLGVRADHLEGGLAKYPRLLVVDDEPDNLDLLSEWFQHEPWDVQTAVNAKDAWALMKRWHPDLVLLDVRMPEFSGHHLCTAIRMKGEYDDVQVVFISAERTCRSDIERGMSLGASDYICKPIDGRDLCERVRSMLAARWQPFMPLEA
jgi:CheY-like chemotaxis protein